MNDERIALQQYCLQKRAAKETILDREPFWQHHRLIENQTFQLRIIVYCVHYQKVTSEKVGMFGMHTIQLCTAWTASVISTCFAVACRLEQRRVTFPKVHPCCTWFSISCAFYRGTQKPKHGNIWWCQSNNVTFKGYNYRIIHIRPFK